MNPLQIRPVPVRTRNQRINKTPEARLISTELSNSTTSCSQPTSTAEVLFRQAQGLGTHRLCGPVDPKADSMAMGWGVELGLKLEPQGLQEWLKIPAFRMRSLWGA